MKFKIENAAMGRAVLKKCLDLGYKWRNHINILVPEVSLGFLCADNHTLTFSKSNLSLDPVTDVYAFLGDDDGWIENTGEMICPTDMRIDIVYFDNEQLTNCVAKEFRWWSNGHAEDIKYWRPHRDERRIVGNTPA